MGGVSTQVLYAPAKTRPDSTKFQYLTVGRMSIKRCLSIDYVNHCIYSRSPVVYDIVSIAHSLYSTWES